MAIQLNPMSVDAMAYMYQAYHLLDRNDLAMYCADRLIQKKPDSPWGYLLKATSYLAMGRHDDAIQFAGKALEKDKRLPEAYLALALGAFENGQFNESIKLIDLAASLDASGYEALLIKAFVVLNASDTAFHEDQGALSMATKADKAAKSSDVRCLFVLAQALAAQGKYAEAAELMDRCVKWPGICPNQQTLLKAARAAFEKHLTYRANAKLVLWRGRPYEP